MKNSHIPFSSKILDTIIHKDLKNPYIPFPSEILEVIKHTEKEYTFRMEF